MSVFYPTPPETASPGSPRKMRKLLRESEDVDCDLFIEDFLYRSDPYRATNSPNPLPYPVQFLPVPHDLATKFRERREGIEHLMEGFGLPSNFTLSIGRVVKPGYPDGDVPRLTVRVEYRGRSSLTFGEAKDALAEMLFDENGERIDVEVVNADYCFRPSLFPIHPAHKSVEIFSQIKDDIVEELSRSIPSRWTMTSLFQVGRHLSEISPTIVIMVRPKTFYPWADLTASIRRIISARCPSDLYVDVEFLPGYIASSDEEEISGKDLSLSMDPDGSLGLGTSIGDSSGKKGGSLGGLVTLTHNGVSRSCGIANYHVARPVPNGQDTEKVDRSGCSERTRSELVYFMPHDIQATRLGIDEAKREYEGLLHTTQCTKERIMMNGQPEPPEGVKSAIEYFHNCIDACRKKSDTVSSMPRQLGNIVCSSGLGIWYERVQDWALIELDQALMPFVKRNRMPTVEARNNPRAYGCGVLVAEEGQPLHGLGELRCGEWYVRVGRTSTGYGVCNGVLACCNWAGKDTIRYDERGNKVDMQSRVTMEYLILNRKTEGEGLTQVEFALHGDSGSLLIDRFGQVSGLYYGNAASWVGPGGEEVSHSSAGLAMTTSDLVKGIEKQIGGQVALSLT